jgi:ascorbate-specific PTS system EIIC-type component UlaA
LEIEVIKKTAKTPVKQKKSINHTSLRDKYKFLKSRNFDIGIIIIMLICAMTLVSIAGPLIMADGGNAIFLSGVSFSIAAGITVVAAIVYLFKLLCDVKHLTDIEKQIHKKR